MSRSRAALALLFLIVAVWLSSRWWLTDVLTYLKAQDETINLLASVADVLGGLSILIVAWWGLLRFKNRDRNREQEHGEDAEGDPTVTEDELDDARQCYLDYLIDTYRYLELKGMGVLDRVAVQLELSELFVPLEARPELPEGQSGQPDGRVAGRSLGAMSSGDAAPRLGAASPVLDMIAEHDGLVVLGDPGSGKTTLLKYLAVAMARGESLSLDLGPRLPVVVPLSAYANALEDDENCRIDTFVGQYVVAQGGERVMGDVVRASIEAGKSLLLLDGLDEVRDMGLRDTVARRVKSFFAFQRKAGNKFVITSRIVGYREVRPVTEGLAECTLVDFGDDEVATFVRQWTAALERRAKGETRAAEVDAEAERVALLAAVRANDGVRKLAANPLLLTILALMKRQGVTLPERRVELYEHYVRTLLSGWNRARGLDRSDLAEPDVVETLRSLAPLALWMHTEDPGMGLVGAEPLQRKLDELFTKAKAPDPTRAARAFLDDVHKHTGVLIERGNRRYGFAHLTFEEYLCGVAMAMAAQGNPHKMVKALAAKLGDPAWREPSLLMVGYVGRIQQLHDVAGTVLETMACKRPGKPGEAVVFAGQALLDVGASGVGRGTHRVVIKALVETVVETDVPARLRLEAGDALGRLGDPREGVGVARHGTVTVPTIVWCPVPAGPFLMGSAQDEDDTDVDEKPQHELHLDHYWISRYPITNAQYAPFVEGGGYDEPSYWTEAGRAWLRGEDERDLSIIKNESVRDAYRQWLAARPAADRRVPKFWHDRKLASPSRPVVGVSWYEAQAFVAWLEAQRRAGVPLGMGRTEVPADYGVHLPNEPEWEKAARGEDGRRWPWGNESGSGNGNTSEAELAETCAVGLFPNGASPCGAHDLVGNVWEWTRSAWGQEIMKPDYRYPYGPSDGRERQEADALRVLRGGSFYDKKNVARCSYRYGGIPEDYNNFIGFRVVLSLAYSES